MLEVSIGRLIVLRQSVRSYDGRDSLAADSCCLARFYTMSSFIVRAGATLRPRGTAESCGTHRHRS